MILISINIIQTLPLDWHLDEVLLWAMPKKDGWESLVDGLRAMEVVVSRWNGEKCGKLYKRASSESL